MYPKVDVCCPVGCCGGTNTQNMGVNAMKYLLMLLLAVAIIYGGITVAHENDEFKHGAMPPCYGWERMDTSMRRCFIDGEHEMCVTLIYNHGRWHQTKPYECPKEEENE